MGLVAWASGKAYNSAYNSQRGIVPRGGGGVLP